MSQQLLIGQQELSEITGIPRNTLKDYRAKNKGPRSAVVGGKVKYRYTDVLTWMDQCFEESERGTDVVPQFTPLGKRAVAA
ncbi:helix-turn-helix domain-containing protein [Mycolicibacterium sp. CBMA 361]|uniref:helix-turn-helix domain-containing protein n=1 Tax=Mycolicibacterium sp. CBMA 361 TaxID=2606610 RepID=UPI0012DFDA77|nr:helix-turn-helix domain-containing protein [Mycolicibacterium sp. CBMA 361]MUM33247.1 helix-turn-helix domain-containing protein [Mycolicibacterium sp. CBMA 361]